MNERYEVMRRVYACGLRVAPDPESVFGGPEAMEDAKEPEEPDAIKPAGHRYITPRCKGAEYHYASCDFIGRPRQDVGVNSGR